MPTRHLESISSTIAFGSNLFHQLVTDDDVADGVGHDGADEVLCCPTRCRAPLDDDNALAEVVAASWSQVIFCSRSGRLVATGAGKEVLQGHLNRLREVGQSGPMVWLGHDSFNAFLDSDGLLHLLDQPDLPSPTECITTKAWKAAASDGRGRVLALDTTGTAFFFSSLSSMAIFSSSPPSPDTIARCRFTFHNIGTPPNFQKVSAGWSHFILLSDSSFWPVWVVGDTRFGIVPLPSRLSEAASKVIGTLTGQSEEMVPLEYFSRSYAGFPATVTQVASGGRHVMVRTEEGDVYGWGWNGEGQTCHAEQGLGQESITADPVLVQLQADGQEEEEDGVMDVACGAAHSILVGSTGKVWVAGSNEHGQLGLPSPAPGTSCSDAISSSIRWRPRTDRAISQIKPVWRCTDGPVLHPHFGPGRQHTANGVVCASWGTLVNVRMPDSSS